MAFTKVHYKDGETIIVAKNLNDIQDAILKLEKDASDIDAALDAIIEIQESLIGGGGV